MNNYSIFKPEEIIEESEFYRPELLNLLDDDPSDTFFILPDDDSDDDSDLDKDDCPLYTD